MIAALQCIVLDCPDPPSLAAFYQVVLGGAVNRPDPRWSLDADWTTLHTASGLVLGFQRAEDYRAPEWPNPSRPQQFHLDFAVDDLDRAEQEVLEAGANLLDDGDSGSRVYADPAGHPFCLIQE
ncbi:VOC family protein [Streptomyces beijiangensis]|uniref:VOC family protein n=1 Tax=Streptomyces beijiangensis TaxID=163361 RepID=A0A939F241_9ACTN|nr:VOC family protein [Streptomyces beijiangensis]MBO0510805.1 VOC family protein [Streptomyces beijiangensis]